MLVEAGAEPPPGEPVEDWFGAVMAGRLVTVSPQTVAEARRRRPAALVWAAACGRLDAVRTLLDHRFDVNARGRSDTLGATEWETALHAAIASDRIDDAGRATLVDLLLTRGADPTIRDARFDVTALGWAEHFGRTDLIDRLS